MQLFPSAAGPAGRLGIDVGGTKVALRLEGDVGDVPPREVVFRWPTSADVGDDLRVLADNVAVLRERWALPVAAVGVAMPATLDAAGRVVAWPGRPSWLGLDLAGRLGELFDGVPVACADDGDLAALAEADRANCDDLLYLGVGTGVGGGVVLGGRSCPGSARGSCEVGHLVIQADGARCDCGRRGCVQAVASGRATLRRASSGRGADVNYAELQDAWSDGTQWAVRAVLASAEALAVAVVGLSELLHPSLAVVGGGFADGLPGFVPAIDDRARALARPGHPAPPVREAALGGLSSLHGAVSLARRTG